MLFNIWEGTYSSFGETPACGDGFESDRWINSSEQKLCEMKSRADNGKLVLSYNNSPLPIIASLIYSEKESLSILDFGGGMGLTYTQLINSSPELTNLKYSIVEGKKVCERGKKLFRDDDKIGFTETLPDKNTHFDILHISSSLQYIEDWQELLSTLCGYKAKYFIFSDLYAGDIQTFVTVQNYYDSKIPCRFFSFGEVVKKIEKVNYRLVHTSEFHANILGQYSHMPMENFSGKMRVGHSKNLIFRLADE